MKRRYFCPRCNANLNPNVKIILMVRSDDQQGLMLLSPQPGNYQSIVADEIEFEEGEVREFRCPVCAASLTDQENPGMACLRFHFSNGTDGTVYFSRKMGEHATYFVYDDEVRVFGDDATPQVGMNFFGSGHQEQD